MAELMHVACDRTTDIIGKQAPNVVLQREASHGMDAGGARKQWLVWDGVTRPAVDSFRCCHNSRRPRS